MERLPLKAEVLDIGCGDGMPVDRALIDKGFLVTGIDISGVMIAQARKQCPRGDFRVRDMRDLIPQEFVVQGIVCLYALFHIDRKEHLEQLSKWRTFLPTGGWLLLTMGDREFEGEHACYGVPMWSSHFGPEKNTLLVQQAGFRVVTDELDTSGNERHQILLAQAQ
jgi:trans-aconitate methyltransferase